MHQCTKVKVQAKCDYDEDLASSNDREMIIKSEFMMAATAAVHRCDH